MCPGLRPPYDISSVCRPFIVYFPRKSGPFCHSSRFALVVAVAIASPVTVELRGSEGVRRAVRGAATHQLHSRQREEAEAERASNGSNIGARTEDRLSCWRSSKASSSSSSTVETMVYKIGHPVCKPDARQGLAR